MGFNHKTNWSPLGSNRYLTHLPQYLTLLSHIPKQNHKEFLRSFLFSFFHSSDWIWQIWLICRRRKQRWQRRPRRLLLPFPVVSASVVRCCHCCCKRRKEREREERSDRWQRRGEWGVGKGLGIKIKSPLVPWYHVKMIILEHTGSSFFFTLLTRAMSEYIDM